MITSVATFSKLTCVSSGNGEDEPNGAAEFVKIFDSKLGFGKNAFIIYGWYYLWVHIVLRLEKGEVSTKSLKKMMFYFVYQLYS